MTKAHVGFLLFAVACLLCFGCGPVKSTMMIRDAEGVLNQALEAEADQKLAGTYFYWAAHEYLIKAKTSHGRAEFFKSEEFAARSMELGKTAIERSQGATLRVVDPKAVSDQYPWILRSDIEPEPPVVLPPAERAVAQADDSEAVDDSEEVGDLDESDGSEKMRDSDTAAEEADTP